MAKQMIPGACTESTLQNLKKTPNCNWLQLTKYSVSSTKQEGEKELSVSIDYIRTSLLHRVDIARGRGQNIKHIKQWVR